MQLVLDRPILWALPASADAESAKPTRAVVSEDQRAEEQRLVASARSGDERALATIYRRYRPRVFSVVARLLGVAEAEEVTQEVFLRAFRGLDGFRAESQLSTWLYRIAVNSSLSERSRRTVERSRRAPLADAEQLPAPEREQQDPALRARLESALAALPPGYRAVLVLHDIEGLEHEEIGRVLGCRVGTSKSQLHKARAKMRSLIGLAGVR